MRIFWCCALSVYAGIFFNTIINLWNKFDFNCFDELGRIGFSVTLIWGLILAACSYLSSILEEIKIKELPNAKAKELRRERNKSKQKEQIKWIKILGYISIAIGLIIDKISGYQGHMYIDIYILLIITSISIEARLEYLRQNT